jgi:hypothetical protein
MEPEREKPWLRGAPNELIVNSILAAISTIVVQTIVTSGEPKYGTVWLLAAFVSLLLFVISAEQLGESIREVNIGVYIRSSILYNIGVLLLLLSLSAIFNRYTDWGALWSIIIFIVIILSWGWVWGWDTVFLICRGKRYDRWKRKMDGEVVEGEILDHYDIFWARITRWRR